MKLVKTDIKPQQGTTRMYDIQVLVNSLGGLVIFLSGFVIDGFRKRLSTLREDNKDLRVDLKVTNDDLKITNEKVQEIQVLVAGKYLTREEHDKDTDLLHGKVDQIIKLIREVPCNSPHPK